MRLVEPWIKVENFDGVKIMKRIERACRTCYRSEDKISEESYKNLLTNCLNRGHESVLEHEKITVRIYSDIGTYKDLTRHRFASFSVESTRYCSYNKDKYGNEIAVVNPVYMEDKEVFEGAKENLIFENREISTDTLKNPIKDDSAKDVDSGIRAGFEGILKWIEERKEEERKSFIECLKKVYVYRVLLPKKTDPCKYFVRMNARGKQLEPVDVIKARLMIPLKGKEEDLEFFKYIWDACSRMDRYIQKTIDKESCDEIFKEWKDKDWKDGFLWTVEQKKKLEKDPKREVNSSNDDANRKSIINFPTFLMHVLKLC